MYAIRRHRGLGFPVDSAGHAYIPWYCGFSPLLPGCVLSAGQVDTLNSNALASMCRAAGKTLCDKLLGAGAYDAAVCLQDPTLCYQPIQPPPPPGSPTGPALTVPPADGQQAQAEVDAILAKQIEDWKKQNGIIMAASGPPEVGSPETCPWYQNLQDDGTCSLSLAVVGGVIAAAVLGLMVLSGGRR